MTGYLFGGAWSALESWFALLILGGLAVIGLAVIGLAWESWRARRRKQGNDC